MRMNGARTRRLYSDIIVLGVIISVCSFFFSHLWNIHIEHTRTRCFRCCCCPRSIFLFSHLRSENWEKDQWGGTSNNRATTAMNWNIWRRKWKERGGRVARGGKRRKKSQKRARERERDTGNRAETKKSSHCGSLRKWDGICLSVTFFALSLSSCEAHQPMLFSCCSYLFDF